MSWFRWFRKKPLPPPPNRIDLAAFMFRTNRTGTKTLNGINVWDVIQKNYDARGDRLIRHTHEPGSLQQTRSIFVAGVNYLIYTAEYHFEFIAAIPEEDKWTHVRSQVYFSLDGAPGTKYLPRFISPGQKIRTEEAGRWSWADNDPRTADGAGTFSAFTVVECSLDGRRITLEEYWRQPGAPLYHRIYEFSTEGMESFRYVGDNGVMVPVQVPHVTHS